MALHMRYYCFSIDVPPGDEPEKYIVLPFFWVPEDAIPRRVKANSVPYNVNLEGEGFTEGQIIHGGHPVLRWTDGFVYSKVPSMRTLD